MHVRTAFYQREKAPVRRVRDGRELTKSVIGRVVCASTSYVYDTLSSIIIR